MSNTNRIMLCTFLYAIFFVTPAFSQIMTNDTDKVFQKKNVNMEQPGEKSDDDCED